jgi:hypothetical protein
MAAVSHADTSGMRPRTWFWIVLTVGQLVGLGLGVWWAIDTASQIGHCGDANCITGSVREQLVPFIAKLTATTAVGLAIAWIAYRLSRRTSD